MYTLAVVSKLEMICYLEDDQQNSDLLVFNIVVLKVKPKSQIQTFNWITS